MIVGNLVMSLAPPACAASKATAATTPGTRNASWTNQVSSTSPCRVSSAVLTRQRGPGSGGPAGPGVAAGVGGCSCAVGGAGDGAASWGGAACAQASWAGASPGGAAWGAACCGGAGTGGAGTQ